MFTRTRSISTENSIDFQIVDLDWYKGPSPFDEESWKEWKPIIRLFGVTSNGASIVCRVHGFFPYFYGQTNQIVRLGSFQTMLEELLRKEDIDRNRVAEKYKKNERIFSFRSYVVHVEPCWKTCMYTYQQEQLRFYQIMLWDPKKVKSAERMIQSNEIVNENQLIRMKPYESNIDFIMRFMIDMDLKGFSWVTIPLDQVVWDIEEEQSLHIHYSHLQIHEPVLNWAEMAPIRTLSFDIECAGRPGIFPDPWNEHDKVIDICCYVSEYGVGSFHKVVFSLGTCDAIDETDIWEFDSESKLLLQFREYVSQVDPDVITVS